MGLFRYWDTSFIKLIKTFAFTLKKLCILPTQYIYVVLGAIYTNMILYKLYYTWISEWSLLVFSKFAHYSASD
jgi:hypothetical protein